MNFYYKNVNSLDADYDEASEWTMKLAAEPMLNHVYTVFFRSIYI